MKILPAENTNSVFTN